MVTQRRAYDSPDPLIATHFGIEIGGIMAGYFTECSGLNAETEVTEYQEGGVNDFVHKLAVRTKYSNVTLKRGLVPNDDLWKWYLEVIQGKIIARKVSILIFDYQRNGELQEKGRWSLNGAYPVKWTGPTFNASQDAVAVESLELAHQFWQRS